MSETEFLEKQYFGLNKMSLARRMSLALFCFTAYYWRENHEKSGKSGKSRKFTKNQENHEKSRKKRKITKNHEKS